MGSYIKIVPIAAPGASLTINVDEVEEWHGGSGEVRCTTGPDTLTGSFYLQSTNPSDPREVAICSAAKTNVFLRMDALGHISNLPGGGGQVNAQTFIGEYEKFIIEFQPNGTVAFASKTFKNVYMRADLSSGTVNVQQGVGIQEQFIINPTTLGSLTLSDIEEVIKKYAPVMCFHSNESHLPVTPEYFLSNSTLYEYSNSQEWLKQDFSLFPLPLVVKSPKVEDLPQRMNDYTDYYLDFDSKVAPPVSPDHSVIGKAYVHATWQPGKPYTDIQFWFLYAQPSTIKLHVEGFIAGKKFKEEDINLPLFNGTFARWEYVTLRIDNSTKTPKSVSMSSNGKKTEHWWDWMGKTEDMHPMVYVGLGTHGNYPSVGGNYSHWTQAPTQSGSRSMDLNMGIANLTTANGARLDASKQYEIVGADWLPTTETKIATPKWLTYPYRWSRPDAFVLYPQRKLLERELSNKAPWIAHFINGEALSTALSKTFLEYVGNTTRDAGVPPLMHPAWSAS
jgi:hypothetical protein